MRYVPHMPNDTQTDNDLLTTAMVAQMLYKDVSTISRMVARGDLIPAVKVPGMRGAYLFRRAYFERRTPSSPLRPVGKPRRSGSPRRGTTE